MKRILFILISFSASIVLHSQNENPFAEFGYDVLVATSSKGEFIEFHDQTDIVEIGSVLFNRRTKKILKVLDKDETTIDISSATAAMSIDPMCEKYYWISPYVYCANNPMRYIDPTGMWYDEANEKEAQKQEKALNKQIASLNKQIAKLESKGKDIGDRGDRVAQMQQSLTDISDMRGNEGTEFRYASASDKNNPAGKGNPTIDGVGTNTVTMYVEGNMGSKVHEGRHGGDVARGTLTLANYSASHEVSAYKAQYAYNGKIDYLHVNATNQKFALSTGMQPPASQINSMSAITPAFVNSIGTMQTMQLPGKAPVTGLMNLYPPKVWTGTSWHTIPANQWNK